MNLVLLFAGDFVAPDRVIVRGRRRDHIAGVHRARSGDTLVVGVANGAVGTATVESVTAEAVEMCVALDSEPPAPSPIALVLALPRPKVLNRVIASATSMGVKRLALINAWRVEKSYWKSPRLSPENLHAQCVAGLEQARDTMLPAITLHRFFRRFVEDELDAFSARSKRLVAHPYAASVAPRSIAGPVTLVIGPEGGFIDEELASLARAGFEAVTLGDRVLRVETAVAALIARLT